jgi:hypothetical protein
MVYQRIFPAPFWFILATVCAIATAVLIIVITRRFGVEFLRTATLVPLVCLLFFLLGMNGHLLDQNYSARPLARQIAQVAPAPAWTIAVPDYSGANDISHASPYAAYGVRRDIVYGLSFYRNQAVWSYAQDGVPADAHILIIPTRQAGELPTLLPDRVYQQLFLYETQGLSVYKVYAHP